MSNQNQQIQQMPQKAPAQKMSFSAYVNSKTGQSLINNVIKNPAKRDAFVTAIISAVSVNPALAECSSPSIISAALQGISLGLAPSPQLGQFYMVPFKNKAKTDKKGNVIKPETTEAVFIPGYKGYIQLAYRSGQYLDIDARPVVDGEYKGLDKFTGRPVFQWIEDDTIREQMAVIGYMAYFELVNGARKVLYWSKEKMINHADRFSPAFSKNATGGKVSFEDFQAGNYPEKDEWKYSSFWYKDFDSMACKTMLRQLITKWGPVSVEMETAVEQDSAREAEGVDFTSDFQAAALPAAPAAAPELPEETAPAEEPPTEEDSGEGMSLDDL